MLGTDWLRRKAAARKPATGGIVRYDPAKPLVLPTGYIIPTPAGSTPGGTALPEGVTIQLRGYTETTAEERRQFLDTLNAVMGRPKPELGPARREQAARLATLSPPTVAYEDPPRCPCGLIYSRCYYPVTHAPARPRTSSN
jgi:hypothetical protein